MSCRYKDSVYVYVESNEVKLSMQGQKGHQACLKASHLREIVSNAREGRGNCVAKLLLVNRWICIPIVMVSLDQVT